LFDIFHIHTHIRHTREVPTFYRYYIFQTQQFPSNGWEVRGSASPLSPESGPGNLHITWTQLTTNTTHFENEFSKLKSSRCLHRIVSSSHGRVVGCFSCAIFQRHFPFLMFSVLNHRGNAGVTGNSITHVAKTVLWSGGCDPDYIVLLAGTRNMLPLLHLINFVSSQILYINILPILYAHEIHWVQFTESTVRLHTDPSKSNK